MHVRSPSRTAWRDSSSDVHRRDRHVHRAPVVLRIARGGCCMTLSPSRELPATESLILGLDEYIRARYGLLAVQTFEEERFLRFMRGVADHERHRAKGLYVWSRVRGLRKITGPDVGAEPKPIPNREDALSLLEYIEEAEQGLYVLCDFAPYLLEYGAPRPELIRRLRELAWAIRSRPVTVIFLGARF